MARVIGWATLRRVPIHKIMHTTYAQVLAAASGETTDLDDCLFLDGQAHEAHLKLGIIHDEFPALENIQYNFERMFPAPPTWWTQLRPDETAGLGRARQHNVYAQALQISPSGPVRFSCFP